MLKPGETEERCNGEERSRVLPTRRIPLVNCYKLIVLLLVPPPVFLRRDEGYCCYYDGKLAVRCSST